MKTSKIILFSYIGLLALAFFIFVIYLTQINHKYEKERGELKTITKDLPAFKYISVDQQSVQLKNDDKTFISALVKEDSDVPDIAFTCSNDTLFINHSGNYMTLIIHLKNSPELNLINHNSNIFITDFSADTMNYTATGKGQISGFKNTNIGIFNAGLFDSQLNAYNGSIDHLNLKSEKSKVYVTNKINSVNAQIVDNSDVRLKGCNKIDIEKDDSSKFNCYQ